MTADIKNINCNLEKFETIKTIVVALGLYEQFDDMGAKEVGNKITPSYRKTGTWMNGAGIFYQIQKNEDKIAEILGEAAKKLQDFGADCKYSRDQGSIAIQAL